VLKNAKSKILEPEDEIYTLKVGETVTITIEAEYPREHHIVATWSARNGKVFPTPELINIYTAQKAGPDVVIIYLWNEDTSDELEESIIICNRSFLPLSRSRCLWAFSTITTEASTITPMAMAIPPRDMMLALIPM